VRDNTNHIHRLLETLDAESALTQRALASRLGIALGSTNQLVRELIARRWIHGVRNGGSALRYIVTADGQQARAKMAREKLRRALDAYGVVYGRVREALAACQTKPRPTTGAETSVALYGTGGVAQIAFACAVDLGVTLVGFVEDGPRESFLGLPVRSPREVRSMALAGRPFDWLLVASFGEDDGIRGRLKAQQFPLDRVNWI
jgi:DNA-binding MarR family transcriptional regulator